MLIFHILSINHKTKQYKNHIEDQYQWNWEYVKKWTQLSHRPYPNKSSWETNNRNKKSIFSPNILFWGRRVKSSKKHLPMDVFINYNWSERNHNPTFNGLRIFFDIYTLCWWILEVVGSLKFETFLMKNENFGKNAVVEIKDFQFSSK